MVNLKVEKKTTHYRLNFLLGAIVVSFFFLFGRWGVWNYFPYTVIYSDSFEYYELAYTIFYNKAPSFHFIGGGYPLILSAIKGLYNTPFSIVVFQQLFSLFSVLLLTYTFRKDSFFFWASLIFSCLYITSDAVIKWELAIFTDSVFSNLFLLSGILFYLTLSEDNWYNPIMFGFIFFYCIFIRSSAVFLIPLMVAIMLFLLYYNKAKSAIFMGISFFGLLLLLASYNYFFSLGNKFSILTYGRFTYVEGPFNNSSILSKNSEKNVEPLKLSSAEQLFVHEKIKTELPQGSDIWIRNFSWDLPKYSVAVINTRYGIFTKVQNDSLYYCCRGNMLDVKCFPLKKEINLSVDSLNVLVSNFQPKASILKLKSFLAYYTNLILNYDQAYYGMVPSAHRCSADITNQFTIKLGQTEKGRNLIQYVLGKDFGKKDDLGFKQRWKFLISDPLFKGYDLFNDKISKRFFRTSLWIFAFLFSFIILLTRLIRTKVQSPISLLLIFYGFILIGQSLVFTFFGNALPRYSFSTEFIFYLNVLFFVANEAYVKFKRQIN